MGGGVEGRHAQAQWGIHVIRLGPGNIPHNPPKPELRPARPTWRVAYRMSNLLIGVTIDPLVAGIMWTEHNDPFTDHVTYSFSPEQLEAMQQDYATGPMVTP